MIIRKVNEEDISEIKRIIDSLQVTRNQRNWKQKTSGFFEYTKTEQELIEAINPYFILAENLNGIRGFNLAYDSDFFKKKFRETKYKEWKYILNNVKGNFVYYDLLGVLNPSTLNSGRIAKSLMENIIQETKINGIEKIAAFICHEPLLNIRSKGFCEKYGFKKLGKVNIENEVVLGYYELKL